jgi:hypothetical protein
MPQPVPPPPPQSKGISFLTLLLLFAIVVVAVGYFQGWWNFTKDPETGKSGVTFNPDKFKQDKDAVVKKTGEYLQKGKDKIASMMNKSKDAATKPDEKAAIEKQIADMKKELEKLETSLKNAEAASDDAGLKKAGEGLDDTVKKLLDPK